LCDKPIRQKQFLKKVEKNAYNKVGRESFHYFCALD